MAEGGAHVTSATPTSGRPSIFEVLAQESLMGAVRPALRHAVKVLAETRPAGFAWLYQYYEETYTLLDLVLQNHFLKKFGGSFSENFYGLKRVLVDDRAVPKLQPSQRRLSLITLVIWPYIRLKLEKKYEEIEQKFSGQFPVSQDSVPFVHKLYRVVFPYIHTLYEGTLLCYHMAYVFGRSECHSPLLRLCGVKLQTMGPDDDFNMNSTLQHRARPVGVISLALEALNYAATALSTGLSVGVFFLQFLDWWYASDHNTAALTALPVPPAPQKSDLTPAADGICPLCQRSRSNDTALSVSGYVFCYPCVYSYVSQYSQCPVTDLPCNTDQLIKLYLTHL